MSKVIGITGGIGSGKSTVSKMLGDKLNSPILDADKISKQAMQSQEIINKIKAFFGEAIFTNKAILDRKKLADIVFSNEQKLLELNKIIHPYVMNKIKEEIDRLADENEYIIIDVPLPNEDFINFSDKIIVVVANEENRIKRVMLRSGLTEEEVKKRIAKQMDTENYIKLADIVIKNNESLEELDSKLNDIINDI